MTNPVSIRRLLGTALVLCWVGCAVAAGQITVFAASSLKEALDEISLRFGAETGHSVSIAYAGSSVLARQIEFGAPADVFISASLDWMDYLESTQDIRPETRVDLLGNRLVLIGGPQLPVIGDISPETDLAAMLGGGRLAMALTEAVPAGIYGKAALQNLGLWDAVSASVAETDNVRAALTLVALGAAPLGVVYATDAAADARVRVLGVFPENAHPEIRYPAALTSASSAPEALQFLDYLRSDTADEVFAARGFIVKTD